MLSFVLLIVPSTFASCTSKLLLLTTVTSLFIVFAVSFVGSEISFTSVPKLSVFSPSLYPSTFEYVNTPVFALPFIWTLNVFASCPTFSTTTSIGAVKEGISLYNSTSAFTTIKASSSISFL